MTTALTKIAQALDALASDLDAQPALAQPAAASQEKTASSADLLCQLYQQHTGEELPASVRDKLAASDDPEFQAVLGKMIKTAAPERPTPLGSPSGPFATEEGAGGQQATKLAWDEFEETIFNGGPDPK